MKNVLADTQRGVVATPTDHICTPRPDGRGEWGVVRGCARAVPAPHLILRQSLHLKYICGKRANADCAEFVFPIYSFLFCHL